MSPIKDSERPRFSSFGDLVGTPQKLDYPDWILRLIKEVSSWLTERFPWEGLPQGLAYDEMLHEDPEVFFDRLKWLHQHAMVLPADGPMEPYREAVALWIGELSLDEPLRAAVDYSLLFSQGQCERVWILTDCWIPCDVDAYSEHIQAMTQRGVVLRFIMMTPWGWIELPLDEPHVFGRLPFFNGHSDNLKGRLKDR